MSIITKHSRITDILAHETGGHSCELPTITISTADAQTRVLGTFVKFVILYLEE